MVNINTALPAAIAVPFHPPTEALRHDNLIKPVIPKTEMIASYTKLREDEKRTPFSKQARDIIQDENEAKRETQERQQQSTAEQRRLNFFVKRATKEEKNKSKALVIMKDLKLAISVIQEKYKRAVSPIPDPAINYAI
ncbi:hypothetical protein [Psychromonas hadalis]|uniref:hypothetical protein n=1 Tax=Psychromonas hadalis TaxID=211669 RepID=UPI0003B38EB3|nr:hypothetical protein [Psychromonas hadalis]